MNQFGIPSKLINSPTSNMINENKSSQILRYADIDVIGRTKLDVESIFLEIEKAASLYSLMVNADKTKYMLSSRRERSHNQLGPKVNMGKYNIEVVNNFVYLGSEVTSNNEIIVEFKRRIVLSSLTSPPKNKMVRFSGERHQTKRSTKLETIRQKPRNMGKVFLAGICQSFISDKASFQFPLLPINIC